MSSVFKTERGQALRRDHYLDQLIKHKVKTKNGILDSLRDSEGRLPSFDSVESP